jgi:hypothetical protein
VEQIYNRKLAMCRVDCGEDHAVSHFTAKGCAAKGYVTQNDVRADAGMIRRLRVFIAATGEQEQGEPQNERLIGRE